MILSIEILDGTQGLFAASQNISAAEWQAYIEELHLPIRRPGIKTMSFVRMVPHEQKTGYERHVNRIFPPGDRDNYFVTEYIMPLAGNESERGSDLGHESVRRTALERARDADEPITTGRITLAQDPPQQAAIRLFLPIYRPGVAHNTVQ